ncbi:thermostable beta-glucosidase [Choiromyces venosus 120613-1]|uniref:beta-glucosidase n=1 Tax=Choiromyces venosus 120613-1 TaxID=1336337 RepID=A0A3N4JD93_9PEZI|nr:thermostable beta-glucosidase [Choiromyces venosus 120613-1]
MPGFNVLTAAHLLLSSSAVLGQTNNSTEDAPIWPLSPPYYPSPRVDGAGDWQEAYAKAKAFVDQLTILEKVNLTTGLGWQQSHCVGNVGAIPRLNFPSLCLQDSPLGVRLANYVSAFPAGMNAAATWDRALMYERGVAMGEEFRGKGANIALGPVAGPLGRHPEGGRNWEGFSVDPWATGIAMWETVKGIQDAGVVATAKHYIGNEQEHFRQADESNGFNTHRQIKESISSNIDERTMHELYLWPFADAVRAGVGAIMCSYQQVNNSYGCQNSRLLNGLLKDELDFQGFVMSDWQAQHSGISSGLAGIDMSMPGDVTFGSGTSYWGANLTLAVLNGTYPEWRLTDQAMRIMAAYYKVGQDPKTFPATNFNSWTLQDFGYEHELVKEGYGRVNYNVDVQANHKSVIRKIGADSTVLLKNVDGTLPLRKVKQIGVFGSDAGEAIYGPNGCSDRSCNNGTLAMGWGSGTSNFPYLITPLEAIKTRAIQDNTIVQSVLHDYAYTQINYTAPQATACLTFVNSNAGEGYISLGGNEGDRNNLTLWNNGDTLIQTVAAHCNNTIVIMHGAGAIEVEAWVDHPNVTAVIFAGMPGQESGNAITDVLFGAVNPSGKLPFTMGKSCKDYGVDIMYEPNGLIPQESFTEGLFIDYRHFDKENIAPRFEFGFGMSYTAFNYSNLIIKKVSSSSYAPFTGFTPAVETANTTGTDPAKFRMPTDITPVPKFLYPYVNLTSLPTPCLSPDVPLSAYNTSARPIPPAGGAPGGNPSLYDVIYEISATITNTGTVAGKEVVQLYLSTGLADDPVNVLRGFDKLEIMPEESRTFRATLNRRDLARWSAVKNDWVVMDVKRVVKVGASSRKLYLSGELN